MFAVVNAQQALCDGCAILGWVDRPSRVRIRYYVHVTRVPSPRVAPAAHQLRRGRRSQALLVSTAEGEGRETPTYQWYCKMTKYCIPGIIVL